MQSPEDPTIAYLAGGEVGESLFFQLDTHALHGEWPPRLPAALERELRSASAVVQVESYVPFPQFERALLTMGFQRKPVPALAGSAYTLWVRPHSETRTDDNFRQLITVER